MNGFADDYDAVAQMLPARALALTMVRAKLPTFYRKVLEVNTFLTDTVAFLNAHPGTGPEQRKRYANEFESFAVVFSEWIRVLDELRGALRERAVSTTIRESYRDELVAIELHEENKKLREQKHEAKQVQPKLVRQENEVEPAQPLVVQRQVQAGRPETQAKPTVVAKTSTLTKAPTVPAKPVAQRVPSLVPVNYHMTSRSACGHEQHMVVTRYEWR